MKIGDAPPRTLATMLERLKRDRAAHGTSSKHVTMETVEAALAGGLFQVLGVPCPTTGDGRNVAVGARVPVSWKGGAPDVIIEHHAQEAQGVSALLGAGGIVEELFFAANGQGLVDVWFRNDQQLTALNLTGFVGALPDSQLLLGWGLDAKSFFVATGDPEAPTAGYRVNVFTLSRDPKKVIGANRGKVKATFEKAWAASSTTLHLATVNFDGQLYGCWAQFNIAQQVLMDWNDSLEFEFNDMLTKGFLKFKSIVLDEAHDVFVLAAADVESRRTSGTSFPRGDATHFVDSTDQPTQPRGDGGTWDSADSFFDGPPTSFQRRVWAEADFDPTGPKAMWAIDPGVHLFLCNVTTPARVWKTMRDPFNFVWRKTWVGALRPSTSTALSDRVNLGRVLYGVADFNVFMTGQGLVGLAVDGGVGDALSGAGPATQRGHAIKGSATFRDPVDTSSVGFASGEQENLVTFTGTQFDGPPAQSINEQGPSGSFSVTTPRPANITFTVQNTWTRTFARLFRNPKWRFDLQRPAYIGRRTVDAKGATYAPPGTLGVVALVGESVPGASGWTYVPVTVLGGNPTTYETDVFTDGPNGTTTFTWPYRATTLDSITPATGGEDTSGVRTESVANVDVKSGVARLLRPTFSKAQGDALAVTFLTSDEWHIHFMQVLNAAGAVYLAQESSGLSIFVGADAAEYAGHDFRILRPDVFYEASEKKLRFVLAWDPKTGAPTLQQPTSPAGSYPNDNKLLGRGFLVRIGALAPLTSRSYQAVDDRSVGVNLKVAGT